MNYVLHGLNMGGYGGYIWSAYGFTAAVMGINSLLLKKQAALLRKKIIQDLKYESRPQA